MGKHEEMFVDKYGNCIPEGEKMPDPRYIDYTPVPKQDIKVTMKQVVKLAQEKNKPVRLVIGGSEMIVRPDYAEHLEELFFAGHYYNMNVDNSRLLKLVPKVTDRRG